MTETLSAEEIKRLNSSCEIAFNQDDQSEHQTQNSFSAYTMQRSLNTIEAKDQEIEALKGQVAAFNKELLATEKRMFDLVKDDYSALATLLMPEFTKLQNLRLDSHPIAQAFIASIRAEEREKAIRECLSETQFPLWSKDELVERIESILTKEQA